MQGRYVPRTPAWERTRKRQLQLLIALLFEDGVPPSAVRFFTANYDLFITGDRYSITEMAERLDMSKQSATRHVHALTQYGILRRHNYRSWELNEQKIIELNRRLV